MAETERKGLKAHRARIGGVRRKGAPPLPEDDEYLTPKGKRLRGVNVGGDGNDKK